MSSGAAIEVGGARRTFQSGIETIRAVDGVDLRVEVGTMTCLYGASGSGKTTLLNLIAGLDIADQGTVRVAGRDLSGTSEAERARIRLHHIGVVFQENNLVHEFTALENVVVPLLARGASLSEARDEAADQLARVGIAELADRLPREMSGGQRQRVGIARALAGGREVLVADEPTGALDSANSGALFELVASLCHDVGVAAVVATHDPLGRDRADVVWTMVDGQLDPT
ncbi:ABC transporter ATP-binding protein [Tessaracoccus palaemonis]|uniref:ABC transporter ATP-binding protein n=1 Tax=Tessaracoccus palaemonis TaxID=2829499 RepID=A0ABX8SMP6_9ACTN|nr:ABC transporter ATP-binding protein [Tessaracoccus palaemonis]